MENLLDRRKADGAPFIVYAISAPVFSDRLLIWPYRKETLHWFEGTALLISGGMYQMNSDSVGDEPFVLMDGLVTLGGSKGTCFADRIIGNMLQPEDRVVAYFDFAKDVDDRWAESARAAGVEIIDSGPIDCGGSTRKAYVVGVGAGLSFPTKRLFAKAGCATHWLMASREPDNAFQRAHIEGARSGGPMDVMDYKSWYNLPHHQPDLALEILGDYRLMAELEGPDCYNLSITIRNTAVIDIRDMLARAAADIGVVLFDAGALSVQDEDGEVFEDFPGWAGWQPLPKHWKRVV